jgi:hypothetical protein
VVDVSNDCDIANSWGQRRLLRILPDSIYFTVSCHAPEAEQEIVGLVEIFSSGAYAVDDGASSVGQGLARQ